MISHHQSINRDSFEQMGRDERLEELAQLLCAALKRILTEQSSPLSASTKDSLVDFSPLKSGIARRKLRNRSGS